MRRETSSCVASLNAAAALRSSLSIARCTSAVLRDGRFAEPAKITSSMPEARMLLCEVSPMTQRRASTRFDLPQPFGPTTPVSPGSIMKSVGSTKDLKPTRRRRVSFTGRPYPSRRLAPPRSRLPARVGPPPRGGISEGRSSPRIPPCGATAFTHFGLSGLAMSDSLSWRDGGSGDGAFAGAVWRPPPGKRGAFLHARLVETGGRGVRVRRLGASRAGEIRLTRFLRNPAVTVEEMAAEAAARTAGRCAGRPVLAIQDTTVVTSEGGGGLYLHAVLAVDEDDGAILGLMHACFLARDAGRRRPGALGRWPRRRAGAGSTAPGGRRRSGPRRRGSR